MTALDDKSKTRQGYDIVAYDYEAFIRGSQAAEHNLPAVRSANAAGTGH
ncbi:hypothetical protein BH10ACT8_BH10ACT8_23800 [soil metagenome]